MSTFVDFYISLLGFIHYKLFSDLNFSYPPQLDAMKDNLDAGISAFVVKKLDQDGILPIVSETTRLISQDVKARLSSLSAKFNDIIKHDSSAAQIISDATPLAQFPLDRFEEVPEEPSENTPTDEKLADTENQEAEIATDSVLPTNESVNMFDKIKNDDENRLKYGTLFSGLVFFLHREVPRESLDFIIRAFGGQIGWEECAPEKVDITGEIEPIVLKSSPFTENDPRITHHVVDRPLGSTSRHYLSRHSIQPQWIYDCVNQLALLPVSLYAPGVVLPAHLSPFTSSRRFKAEEELLPTRYADINEEEEEEEEENKENDKDVKRAKSSRSRASKKTKSTLNVGEKHFLDEVAAERDGIQYNTFVSSNSGKRQRTEVKGKNTIGENDATEAEQKKLAMIMMPKKDRRLYQRIQYTERKKKVEENKLQRRRDKLVHEKGQQAAAGKKGRAN